MTWPHLSCANHGNTSSISPWMQPGAPSAPKSQLGSLHPNISQYLPLRYLLISEGGHSPGPELAGGPQTSSQRISAQPWPGPCGQPQTLQRTQKQPGSSSLRPPNPARGPLLKVSSVCPKSRPGGAGQAGGAGGKATAPVLHARHEFSAFPALRPREEDFSSMGPFPDHTRPGEGQRGHCPFTPN